MDINYYNAVDNERTDYLLSKRVRRLMRSHPPITPVPSKPEMVPTVYSAYGDGDRLLYIGCTTLLFYRLRHSKYAKYWWKEEVRRIEIVEYENIEEATEAEIKAIVERRPLYNVTYNTRR